MKADLFFYEKGIWEKVIDYDCIVAMMPSGIVVRQMCPLLKSKWEDPAIVIVDKSMSYAIPILGGHHGGNEVAKKLEGMGMKAVITTAMEFQEGLFVGLGCRRGIKAEEIFKAVKNALEEIGGRFEDVVAFATAELKRNEKGLIEFADKLKKPLIFLKKEELNSVKVGKSKAEIVGLNSVAEAAAVYISKKKELILPKRVYGGVTVAIAR
ncbi:cobalamin (vitamin B12) biosynthesis CbiG protein [Ferroglobus placidus DSM 10642]|uniref:Cobalamin (Vitamin B12) biosynthesis CbiG protein n=1 Tax=Ferroglobus placidus (strain DSM 10642 / AEDII12DO) TaxID=589924 RepID=D3S1D6_FERPA|nr:cobalamin biosynthesis protein [Ferroglobus placidus]ADC66400.1 cobalamin (vitamin B12) biosynthesis CbiG protein [Ferroglobus placidus DSM 10642]